MSAPDETPPPSVPVTPNYGSSSGVPASSFVRNSTFNSGPNSRNMRRPETPRRLKNGIRLRRKEGIEGLSWPSDVWSKLLLDGVSVEVLTEALDYARAGQTASLQITAAGIEATVQGRVSRPYIVTITPEPLAAIDWDRVVAIMAREAVYSAKLLAGEMPPLVEQPFVSLGKELIPTLAATVTRTCTCDLPSPCKHIACVAALTIERVAGDPLLAFTLRGLDGQRLLERLQEARAIATRGVARAHSTPPAVDAAPDPQPLERCLTNFWRPGKQLDDLPTETEPFAKHAILRRLGQSPLQGKFPLVGLLASIYDSIAAHGKELRERGEASELTAESSDESSAESSDESSAESSGK